MAGRDSIGRMRLGALLLAVAILTIAGMAPAAEDAPVRASLRWVRGEGAEGCVSGPALEDAVSARLGRRVFVGHHAADVVVEGVVERARRGPGYAVRLRMRTREGRVVGIRELETQAEHCSALDDPLALVVALTVDIPRERVLLEIPKDTHAPRAPWGFEAGLGGAAELGLLPGPAVGAQVAVALKPPAFWWTELSGIWWSPAERRTGEAGGRFRWRTVALVTCPLGGGGGTATLYGCVGHRLGFLRAVGLGLDRNDEAERLTFNVLAQARGAFRLAGPLMLRLEASAEVPLARERFVYIGADGARQPIHRMAPVGGVVSLGLGLRL